VRFIGSSFASGLLALHLRGRTLLWRLRVHGLTRLLLVAGRRWRVLPRLLLSLRWVLVALLLWLLLVVRQRLSVGTF
jgi:hypothetical protein